MFCIFLRIYSTFDADCAQRPFLVQMRLRYWCSAQVVAKNPCSRLRTSTLHIKSGATLKMLYLIVQMGILSLLAATTAWADMNLGETAYVTGDYETAFQELQPHAMEGNARAQFIVGRMYANGTAVNQSDTEAIRWYELAAQQGFYLAQYSLASMYFYGYGIEQSYKEAVYWWHKAAEQGHPDAQARLGYIYRGGKAAEKDETEAAKWFRMAATQGHMDAQQNLGLMYAKGQGVPQDYISAYVWWSRARKQGSKKAESNLVMLKPLMSQEEVSVARQKISEGQQPAVE